MRYELAYLDIPPTFILAGETYLSEERQEWAQPPELWTLMYYHHGNSVTVNTQTYAVGKDDILVIPPGATGSHARIGLETMFHFLTFNLPAKEGVRAAIPSYVPGMVRIYPDFRRAVERIVDSKTSAISFAWNFLWSQAQSTSLLRGQEVLYVAEDFIRRNLSRKISVEQIAEASKSSPRQLLRAFRAEHGITIQEYIVRKRIQEASRLLLTSELPVKEVAGRVGFIDLQHFNKAMRMLTGVSPRKFREIGHAD